MPDLDFPLNYPEILQIIAQRLYIPLATHPRLRQSEARALAIRQTEDLRRHCYGALYIPRGDAYERTHRNAAICRDFNGFNHSALARRYGLTPATVYDILARARQHRQFPLFD